MYLPESKTPEACGLMFKYFFFSSVTVAVCHLCRQPQENIKQKLLNVNKPSGSATNVIARQHNESYKHGPNKYDKNLSICTKIKIVNKWE